MTRDRFLVKEHTLKTGRLNSVFSKASFKHKYTCNGPRRPILFAFGCACSLVYLYVLYLRMEKLHKRWISPSFDGASLQMKTIRQYREQTPYRRGNTSTLNTTVVHIRSARNTTDVLTLFGRKRTVAELPLVSSNAQGVLGYANISQNGSLWAAGCIVSWREFTGKVRDTHEPALPALHTNSFLDFANVVIAQDTIILHGASAADARFVHNVLKGSLPRYQYFIHGDVGNFPPVRIETRNHAVSTCKKVWDCTAVFLSLWHPDNQYHLMNDNIVPLVINLQSNPACTYSVHGGFVCTPELKLFLLDSDTARNQQAVSSAGLLLDMLVPNRRPAAVLFNSHGETQCVKRLTWGRGRLGFAIPIDHSVTDAVRILREYARIPASSTYLGHTTWNATAHDKGNYTVLLLNRQKGITRSIIDEELVLQACLATGVLCKPCCDFGARGLNARNANWRPKLQTMVTELSNADILFGAHGAGMSMVLFARRSAITVNVMPADDTTWNVIFPRMAVANSGHSVIAYVPCTAQGMHVSFTTASGLLKCACALLSGSTKTACELPRVAVISYLEIIKKDQADVELYKHHTLE